MPDSLGDRLARAGLLTRSDLAEIVATAPAHDAALVRAVVRRGISEDAIAGFFLSEGFGPLLERNDLDRAEPAWARRVPSAMAMDFLALPLRAATDGIVVAMAAPSDAHIVREIGRILGTRVLATVARPSQIERHLRGLHPDAVAAAERTPASEPPVLELTRRRSTTERGYDAGFRSGSPTTKEAKLGPRLALPDDEPAMPLVRHKPAAHTPAAGTPKAAPAEARSVMRTFAKPATAADWRRGEERRSNTAPLMGALAPGATEAAAGAPVRNPSSSSTSVVMPPASDLQSALTGLAERAAEPTSPSADSPRDLRSTAELIPKSTPPPPIAEPRTSVPAPSTVLSPAAATGPLPQESSSAREKELGPAPDGSGRARTTGARSGEASSAVAAPGRPSLAPTSASDERWDLPSSPPSAPVAAPRPTRESANKLSPRATIDLPTLKAAPTDIGKIVADMRGAADRDEVVRLACEGATSVARSAVFFALRKGVLKGWDGTGPGVRRDSVRNLWIPTTSESTFKRVLDTKSGSVGPYGTSVADGLFRAAVGSRGGDFMVQPVSVSGKVVGMLCVDDLRPGPIGAHRIEVLAQTVGDAFLRIISAGKE